MSTLAPLHIFAAGTHTDLHGRSIAFSQADVAATAAAYDPALLEAPLVVGHPQTDDPAYGWVASLSAINDALEATPRQVDPAFAEMVNEERFNRISASFFLPDAPSNPVSGVYYLRHVGFLGAAAPAIKGLRKPKFDLAAETGQVFTIEFALPETSMTEPAPAYQTADFSAREAAIAKAEAELKAKSEAQAADFAERDKALKTREEVLVPHPLWIDG